MNYKNIAILKQFHDIKDLVADFARLLADRIQESKDKNKEFHIALSGGSTPSALYHYLSENQTMLPSLSNVHFYWGDERCVSPDSAESNYGTASKEFLKYFEIPSENIHRIKGENDPVMSSMEYSGLLESLPMRNSIAFLDMIILGMGNDGHTASIFPDRMDLLDSKENTAVVSHPESGQKRITLTGSVINNSKEIVFLVTGKSKATVINEIFRDMPKAKTYPVYYIRPESGKLLWYCDKAATALYDSDRD